MRCARDWSCGARAYRVSPRQGSSATLEVSTGDCCHWRPVHQRIGRAGVLWRRGQDLWIVFSCHTLARPRGCAATGSLRAADSLGSEQAVVCRMEAPAIVGVCLTPLDLTTGPEPVQPISRAGARRRPSLKSQQRPVGDGHHLPGPGDTPALWRSGATKAHCAYPATAVPDHMRTEMQVDCLGQGIRGVPDLFGRDGVRHRQGRPVRRCPGQSLSGVPWAPAAQGGEGQPLRPRERVRGASCSLSNTSTSIAISSPSWRSRGRYRPLCQLLRSAKLPCQGGGSDPPGYEQVLACRQEVE